MFFFRANNLPFNPGRKHPLNDPAWKKPNTKGIDLKQDANLEMYHLKTHHSFLFKQNCQKFSKKQTDNPPAYLQKRPALGDLILHDHGDHQQLTLLKLSPAGQEDMAMGQKENPVSGTTGFVWLYGVLLGFWMVLFFFPFTFFYQ